VLFEEHDIAIARRAPQRPAATHERAVRPHRCAGPDVA
jgi:hypothetical protein